MKKIQTLFLIVLAGCAHQSESVWDETSTAGNYLNKAKAFFWRPQTTESRQVRSEEDFMSVQEDEFIPLVTNETQVEPEEVVVAQPKIEPGAKASPVPGIRGFKTPAGSLAHVFQTVYFNTDDHILRSQEHYNTVARIISMMKKNPNLYVFIEGHCDERASEAYNLSLGTRRANFVRSTLIKQGVDKERIFTISYGKEMPFDTGHNRAAWAKNRRCEFKIYEKPTIVNR